jgi:hypothetical protein
MVRTSSFNFLCFVINSSLERFANSASIFPRVAVKERLSYNNISTENAFKHTTEHDAEDGERRNRRKEAVKEVRLSYTPFLLLGYKCASLSCGVGASPQRNPRP